VASSGKEISAHQWLVIVPARLGSSRLPEKPLADLHGKPLIVRVVENLRPLIELGVKVVVATDDSRVVDVCHQAQIVASMTRGDHVSGTDRCFEIAQKEAGDFVLNVQGDEPFVQVSDLIRLMQVMESDTKADVGTLAINATDPLDFANANVVKVVLDATDRALYFSRGGIPVDRDEPRQPYLRHIGVYSFRRAALERFCGLPSGKLEMREKLEQLRALENGMIVRVVMATRLTVGVDTAEDLEVARAYFQNRR
jgi:3-deoxy-D-manno-octulosonate cytidylyltransferase